MFLIAPSLTEQLASYRDAFDMFDIDSSGTISSSELASVMRSLGQNPTDGEVTLILDKIDIDHSGTIDFDEFVTLMSPTAREGNQAGIPAEQEEDAELKEAFRVFDKDGNGTISFDELSIVMKALGECLDSFLQWVFRDPFPTE